MYALPRGYYGLSSIMLLLAMMALGRLKSIEQLRYVAPGEFGNLLGLDRVPEVRTLREKLQLLCAEKGRAAQWNAELAKQWMGLDPEAEPMFYVDGHVRVYHGELAQLPRHYVARQKLYLRAAVDYWINALDGQPFFYVNQEIDHGLVQALGKDIVPWLETHAPNADASGRGKPAGGIAPLRTFRTTRSHISGATLTSSAFTVRSRSNPPVFSRSLWHRTQ